ncbi:ABC transporter ATP-binding protein [Paractinoplanes rishiriensis]|uniref:Peptide ABC transporter ATP-binding protein n=1 Tax=Paractinoplanes rishiriensis TaxID=1050105 RepID=A0A919JXS5_9ACTN|nr:ATP-binding cassette domain-containing protein [Actinoplanes rishiriensis]GIE95609.1 peptide ABC transporter ATP-binding protein [Actinoplanes rishiriensis]
MSLLALRDVSRTYDDGQPVHALRATTLSIDAGQYVSVTGPSGSGKSTLLNVLGLLDEPTAGSYRVSDTETVGGGQRLHGAVRGQLFGFVFQAFHLLAGRTAVENVEIGMLYGPLRRRQRRRRAEEALDRIGLAHRMHADPRRLSGGERQRVAIARAIAARPAVLFCDEPTGNLDSGNTANVLALLRELNDQGLTLVVVTHDPDVAGHAGRRLQVIDGTVREQ